jgi:ribokinase
MGGRVSVLGSLNVDDMARVPRLPAPGETVTASSSAVHPGGKGANQAVAAARAGAAVLMAGVIGADAGGQLLSDRLAADRIERSLRTGTGPTGRAVILVDDEGENIIALVPGANAEAGAEDVERACAGMGAGDVLLMQLEIPVAAVEAAAARAHGLGAMVVLNAAPARPEIPLSAVDVLVVNERECFQVAGLPYGGDLSAAATGLARAWGLTVVVTLGPRGAVFTDGGDLTEIPSPSVTAVDTTGAGDTFVGYLAASLVAGLSMADSVGRAVRAGALAVTQEGAQPAIPAAGEVDRTGGTLGGASPGASGGR